jgi:hypothetical protein
MPHVPRTMQRIYTSHALAASSPSVVKRGGGPCIRAFALQFSSGCQSSANTVLNCNECHVTGDWQRHKGLHIQGSEGSFQQTDPHNYWTIHIGTVREEPCELTAFRVEKGLH